MKEITLKMPLADIPEGELKVITDGKTFIKVQDEGITELIQVKNELLTPENLSKPSQIIKAENGWKTDRIKKDKEYISYMLEGNDQVSIALLKAGWNNLSDILSFLFSEKELREGKVVQAFMKEYRNLQIFIAYQDKLVAGGLVSAGDGVRFYGGGADVPLGLGGRPGVLIYRAAEGAKLDLKEIASAAQVDYNTLKKLVEKRDIDGVGKLLENGNFQRLLDAVLRKQ
jgi:hypothetical protein